MHAKLILTAAALLGLGGCYVTPTSPPQERVVEREVVDPNG
jgi:hypothetical protein